ncbi:hypothetical protein GE09DRAFT_313153 [Coniochaeta sp. 2T2.1]|nr:hypothetical protein GE09DRAFT_313153 [Coniochaeta sp. 2T2.1]
MPGMNLKYYEQRGHSVLFQIQEETLEKTINRQLQSIKPEHKSKVKNSRNPPLWVLNPSAYTDPATWRQPPKYKIRPPPRIFPISILNALVVKHYRATQRVPLGIRGRYEHLLYLLLATLIAPPNNKCVLVVDCEGDFDISRVLECTPVSLAPLPPHLQPAWETLSRDERRKVRPPFHRDVTPQDLAHVYVIRPADTREGPLCREILRAKEYMLYGNHRSRDRDFWGTFVIGADDPGADVDVVCGTMKCWLKVVRTGVANLAQRGVRSYEGAKGKKAEVYRDRGYAPFTARCPWGQFKFDDRGMIFKGTPREGAMKAGGSRFFKRRRGRAAPRVRNRKEWIVSRSELRAAARSKRRKEGAGPAGKSRIAGGGE